jgi:hypothetical protein
MANLFAAHSQVRKIAMSPPDTNRIQYGFVSNAAYRLLNRPVTAELGEDAGGAARPDNPARTANRRSGNAFLIASADIAHDHIVYAGADEFGDTRNTCGTDFKESEVSRTRMLFHVLDFVAHR